MEERGMETSHDSKTSIPNFSEIEALVHQGKSVVSSEESLIVESVFRTLKEGKTATFYLSPTVYNVIQKRYWTSERREAVGLRPITDEEAEKVKAGLDIIVDGYANSIDCPRCGHAYSTYEFIEQGFKEHGEALVRAVFSTKRLAILQVNPSQDPVCPKCALHISIGGAGPVGGYFYQYACKEGNGYACCQ